MAIADIGIIGGSGFYTLAADTTDVELDTPFGAPSAPIAVGEIAGRSVAFLARHGRDHHLIPTAIPARANLWALAELGVRQIISPCAAGSLRAHMEPEHFVVLDQLVDRTRARADTYHDGGAPYHVAFADPYCPTIAAATVAAAREVGVTVHERGTVVVIEGPRFSTRAESRWYASLGADVVNMTQYPEAVLARELGIHFGGVALITDFDAGTDRSTAGGTDGAGEDGPDVAPVTHEHVFATVERNVDRVRSVIAELIPRLPADPEPLETRPPQNGERAS